MHEANARREAAGQPAINSVWFWGEGALPAAVARRHARVYAGDPLARGLAKMAGIEAGPLPEGFASLDRASGTDALVVLDDLTRPLRRGDIDGWIAAAKSLDERWIAPVSGPRVRWAARAW